MFYIFLLFHVVVGDMFDDHLYYHANSDIDPCHDFYGHICPYPIRNSEVFINNIGNKIREVIRPYLNKDMEAVLRQIEVDHENDSRIQHNASEVTGFIEERCETDPNARHYLQYVYETYLAILEMNHNATDNSETNCTDLSILHATILFIFENMPPVFNLLKRLIEANAFSTYIQTQPSDFEPRLQQATDLFKKLQRHILREAKKSPWIESILPNITDVLETLEFIPPVPHDFTDEFMSRAADYKECYSALSGLTPFDSKLCALALFTVLNRELEKNGSTTNVVVFNAGYYPSANSILISPALLYSGLDENKQEIILTFVIAHEIAHSIYVRGIRPENAACLAKNMEETCGLFNKGFQCISGNYTYQEDVADWVAMQSLLFLFQNHAPVFSNLNQRQSIFYIWGIMWCSNLYSHGADVHSLFSIRVNGVLRQFQEFQEEFNCLNNEQMVAQQKCFLLGKDAVKKSQIFIE